MEIGDIVLYQERRWRVHRYDKMTRTVFLLDQNGKETELADRLDKTDPDTVKFLANPGKTWKVLTAPVKNNAGPFVRLIIPGPLGRREHELVPWKDWIPSDPFRDGGSVFIRPGAKVQPYAIAIFTHRNGSTVRVTIPANFTTVAQKRAPPPPPPPPPTRFTMMDEEDDP